MAQWSKCYNLFNIACWRSLDSVYTSAVEDHYKFGGWLRGRPLVTVSLAALLWYPTSETSMMRWEMDKKRLDELLDTLGFIGWTKSMLPLHLRGWVNALGLYVQEREAGRWTRLQAGGRFRSYLDAWREGVGDWQVRRFDKDTWERRFAHLVEPTSEIADFLSERVAYFGDLDREGATVLEQALQHYKDTGVWLGLPGVPEEVIHRKAKEEARARAEKERDRRIRLISANEKRIKHDPLDRLAWASLPFLYYQEQRYKDMENALKMSLKADASKLGFQYSSTYKELGKTYLAALSVSIRGKGIPIWGYIPSNVTAKALGYNIEQLRALAKENLIKAYDMDKKAGFKEEELKELDLALKAVDALSVEAFEEFDRYKEEERQKDL